MKKYIATLFTVLLSAISFNASSAASNCPKSIEILDKNWNPSQLTRIAWTLLPTGKVRITHSGEVYGETTLEETADLQSLPQMGPERNAVGSWARCHLAANKAGPLSDNGKNSTARTGQLGSAQADIPGRHKDGDAVNCPVRAPRDCVQWSEQNPDLHFWNVNNTCNGPIIVIYEDPSVSNGRTLTDWIPSGNYQSIKAYSRPRFNVYDAKSVTQFHKSRYNKPGDFMNCVMAEALR